jgi:hypothetical protein
VKFFTKENHMSSEQQIIDLLNRFPVMQRRHTFSEWGGDYITRKQGGLKSLYGVMSSGERQVIEFALSVWNTTEDWTTYGYRNFNFCYAYLNWDPAQRKVLLDWAADPFCC